MRRTVSFCCHNNHRFPLPPRAPAGFSVSLQCGAAWTGKGGRGVCAWHQVVAGVTGQGEAVGAEEAQGLRGRRGAKGPGPGAAGRGRGPRPGGRAFTPRRPLTPLRAQQRRRPPSRGAAEGHAAEPPQLPAPPGLWGTGHREKGPRGRAEGPAPPAQASLRGPRLSDTSRSPLPPPTTRTVATPG